MRVALLLLAGARVATAEPFETEASGPITLDAAYVIAKPAALQTGMSTGLGATITHTCGCNLSYGAELSWGRVSEPGATWIVTQDDYRLRVVGAVRHDIGRGSIALQLGVGPVLIHENRDRQQGMRAGLSGDELHTSGTTIAPSAALEAIVTMKVQGPWALHAGAGPAADIFDGDLHAGWQVEVGLAWAP
ncbi:MAG: hypothetical protein QM831_07840 [Kofleriaceae bacterium]